MRILKKSDPMADQSADMKDTLNYYRDAADKAGQKAEAAKDADIRAAYLGIQRTWTYLAEKLEQDMDLEGSHISIDPSDDVFVPGARDNPAHKFR